MTFRELIEAVSRDMREHHSGRYFSVSCEFTRYHNGRDEIEYRVYHQDLGSTLEADDYIGDTPEIAYALFCSAVFPGSINMALCDTPAGEAAIAKAKGE